MTLFNWNTLSLAIREINCLLVSDIESGCFPAARLIDPHSCFRENVEAFVNLDRQSLSALADKTPKLRCWYAPILRRPALREMLLFKPFPVRTPRFECAFEEAYWRLFSKIVLEACWLVPHTFGVPIPVANLVRHNLRAGNSAALIAATACKSTYMLRLSNLAPKASSWKQEQGWEVTAAPIDAYADWVLGMAKA